MLLLRTDIFATLNDPDLNKIKMDNSFVIDWGNRTNMHSPLFDLVLTKIKKSVPFFETTPRDNMFNILFPQYVRGIVPSRFILERTFLRPRDVITYLNFIIEKYPTSKYFGWKGLVELEKKYSEYFLDEIRNELSGHITDSSIDQGLLLLKQFKKHTFTYYQIKEYFRQNKYLYSELDLEEILTIFFRFGLIGNVWLNEYKQKNHYCWIYRDNKATIDFNRNFVIHLGLRKEFNI